MYITFHKQESLANAR